MSTKIHFFLLIALLSFHSVGCKTTEKLAFWKSSENTQTESEVLARSAPALPSQIARQAEALAATGVNITPSSAPGGVAAPYSAPPVAAPTTTLASTAPPSSYPSTGVEGYAPVTTQQTPVASSPSSDKLGTIPMPYNPNSVPAPPTTAPGPSPTVAPTDRYATAPTVGGGVAASHSQPTTTTAAPSFSASQDRYGSYPKTQASISPATTTSPAAIAPASTTPVQQASTSRAPGAPVYTNTNTPSTLQDRYGSQSVASAAPGLAQSQPITPTPSAAPYRPGGTSDYPGQNAMEVASRPSAGSSDSETSAQGTSGQTVYPQSPQYR